MCGCVSYSAIAIILPVSAPTLLGVVGVALRIVYAGQHGVQEIQCALDDAQRSHGNAHLAFRVHVQESLVGHVSLPVMQSNAAHGDPHDAANHVHDGVAELSEKLEER